MHPVTERFVAEAFVIGDGYETDGRIPRAAGIHPELAFTYRPALKEEREAYLRDLPADPARRVRRQADLVVAHVTRWNVTDRSGVAVERPTVAVCERLQPWLMDKLLDVILGYAPSGDEAADLKNC